MEVPRASYVGNNIPDSDDCPKPVDDLSTESQGQRSLWIHTWSDNAAFMGLHGVLLSAMGFFCLKPPVFDLLYSVHQ